MSRKILIGANAGAWLPYAEGRLRALTAIDADQCASEKTSPAVDVLVEVRQVGRETFIRINAGEAPVPDFVSGIVTDPRRITEEVEGEEIDLLKEFYPTGETARLFDLEEDPAPIEKLQVEATTDIPELTPPGDTELGFSPEELAEPVIFHQYEFLKPTMYSGRMRKLVQLLMGFGRQAKRSIYKPAVDYQWKKTKFEQEIKVGGRKIQYDYRWARSHGLIRADDGRQWIMEISAANGVCIMPFLLYPGSRTSGFRSRLSSLNDTAGQVAVDEFGGFPTGESFAVDAEEFSAWKRAGRTVELLAPEDITEFYESIPYSTSCGWAFNYAGDEARNTCYLQATVADEETDTVDSPMVGRQYRLTWSIDPPTQPEFADGRGTVLAAVSGLRESHPNTFDANIYKIGRLSQGQTDSLVGAIILGAEAVYEALDAMVVTPLANAEATLEKVEDGFLFGPSELRPNHHSRLSISDLYKEFIPGVGPVGPRLVDFIPDPFLPGVYDDEILCDTTVYVFFDEADNLRWVKYFYDQNLFFDSPTTRYEDAFYYTDEDGFDNRTRYRDPTDFDIFHYDDWDLGVQTVRGYPNISYKINWFYRRTLTTPVDGIESPRASVTIPFGEREAYYWTAGVLDPPPAVLQSEFIGIQDPDYFDPDAEPDEAINTEAEMAAYLIANGTFPPPVEIPPQNFTTTTKLFTSDGTIREFDPEISPPLVDGPGYNAWFLHQGVTLDSDGVDGLRYLGATRSIFGPAVTAVYDKKIAGFQQAPDLVTNSEREADPSGDPIVDEMVNEDDIYSLSACYVGVIEPDED